MREKSFVCAKSVVYRSMLKRNNCFIGLLFNFTIAKNIPYLNNTFEDFIIAFFDLQGIKKNGSVLCLPLETRGSFKRTYLRFSNGAVITALRVTVYGTNAAARARLITTVIMSW